MMRTYAFFLLTALLAGLLALSGCTEPSTGAEDTGSATETETETGAERADPEEWLKLSENGMPIYTIVYQQSNLPEGVEYGNYAMIARTIATNWGEKLGQKFSTYSDRRLPDGTENILSIGNTGDTAGAFFEGLRYNDYRIGGTDGWIVIAAYTYSSLYISSQHLIDATILMDGELYLRRSVLGETYQSGYQIGSLTVGGDDIGNWYIEGDDTSLALAEKLRDRIREASGVMLTVVTDGNAEKRIVLRQSPNLNGYQVFRTGNEYRIEYGSGLSSDLLWLYLEEKFNNVIGGKSLEMDSLVTVRDTIAERQMMTFNVLNVWNKGGTPGTRDDIAAQTVLSYLPDFLCLQEFDDGYRTAQGGLISQIAGSYTEVVIPGVTATNVWNPIFYLHDRYTLVEAGLVDLAEVAGAEQSTSYPGSADGKSHFRTLVWAVLRDRTDGSLFLIGNFHAGLDTANHANEAKAVSDTLKSVAETHPGCVILVGGDYNSRRSQASGAVANLLAEGFSDPYDSAKIRNDLGTWHTLGKAPDGRYETDAIDHILTIGEIDVQVYMVLTDESLWSASDHCPTVLAFSLK